MLNRTSVLYCILLLCIILQVELCEGQAYGTLSRILKPVQLGTAQSVLGSSSFAWGYGFTVSSNGQFLAATYPHETVYGLVHIYERTPVSTSLANWALRTNISVFELFGSATISTAISLGKFKINFL